MAETARRYMGNSVPRKEDPAFLTGHANWTDNIRLPGTLHMASVALAPLSPSSRWPMYARRSYSAVYKA